jgi:hypothetical protein
MTTHNDPTDADTDIDIDIDPDTDTYATRDDTPLWQVIAAALRADILETRYAPGTPLPSETELANRYHVSRPTVRDAVKALVLEGLVSVVRGRGTFVRPVHDRHLIIIGVPFEDIANPAFFPTVKQWGWTRLPLPNETDDHGEPMYDRAMFTTADRDTATALSIRTGQAVFRRHQLWTHTTRARVAISSATIAELIPNPAKNAYIWSLNPHAYIESVTQDRGPTQTHTPSPPACPTPTNETPSPWTQAHPSSSSAANSATKTTAH